MYIEPLRIPNRHDTFKNAGLMLVHRLQRWPNIKTALVKCVVFAGLSLHYYFCFTDGLVLTTKLVVVLKKVTQNWFVVRQSS